MDRGRVVFAVVGSYGDVHPFMAVALEMQRRGWSPLLLAAPDYAAKAAAAGLAFAPMRPGIAEAEALAPDGAAFVRRLAQDDDFLLRRFLLPSAEASYADARAHVQDAALVVVNHFAFGAQIAAEAADVPLAVLAMQPLVLFSAGDPPSLLAAPWLPALRRRAGPFAVRQVMTLALAARAREGRPLHALRAKLGLPRLRGSWLEAGVRDAAAVVGLWSPLLGGPQPDHPPRTTIAGSLVYDDDPELEDETALDAFVGAGPAPVVFTLGSFAGQAPGDFYRHGVGAARRLGLRTVVVGGPRPPAVLSALAGPDVFVTGYARYSRLFRRASIVAHHGGIGTCQQALRAGAPQLVAPLFGDQPDNARRLAALGVARALPFGAFTEDAAHAALSALSDPQVAARAAELGRLAVAERGAERAADALEGAIAPV